MESIVEISARHIHITVADCRRLFGVEKLVQIKTLSQKNFAAEETVTISGPKNELKGVRIVGPFRDFSQVEMSQTDAIFLGVRVPLRISGDLPGASIKVIGPKGSFEGKIAIVAKRHWHLPTSEASSLGFKHGDIVQVKALGERSLIFDKVIVRVDKDFDNVIHMDTDEANASGIKSGMSAQIINNPQNI
jgi:putative phosphotransacetylase